MKSTRFQTSFSSSGECANRRRSDEMLGGEKVKNFRPKSVGDDEAIKEAEDNSDVVPF